MDIYTAMEESYKRGYENGKRDAFNWIPVTERLPEISGHYLVVIVNGVYRFTDKMYYHEGWWYTFECEVTHWMPMPEPIKEN